MQFGVVLSQKIVDFSRVTFFTVPPDKLMNFKMSILEKISAAC